MTDPSAHLAEWSAAEAAASRARERSLRRQAAESATVGGLFVDWAERGDAVAVSLAGGGAQSGPVSAVGLDYAVVDGAFVPFAAVAAVKAPAAMGDRVPAGSTLLSALADLAAERAAVAVVLDGGEVVAGDLVAASDEVLTLSTAWVPLAAVRVLRLL